MAIEAYPLHWPDGWPRTKQPRESRFGSRLASARDGLIDEIRLLEGKTIILSSNIPLRQDGLPYARYKTPDDAGVAVYFQLRGQSQVFACDRWIKVEDNMQAIRKTIEAIRGIERWGSSEMMNRMFTGFMSLGDGSQSNEWFSVLGVNQNAAWDEVRKAYREKALRHHPDRGGSAEEMMRLNKAMDEAKRIYGNT